MKKTASPAMMLPTPAPTGRLGSRADYVTLIMSLTVSGPGRAKLQLQEILMSSNVKTS